jgi:hypothetical protein
MDLATLYCRLASCPVSKQLQVADAAYFWAKCLGFGESKVEKWKTVKISLFSQNEWLEICGIFLEME